MHEILLLNNQDFRSQNKHKNLYTKLSVKIYLFILEKINNKSLYKMKQNGNK